MKIAKLEIGILVLISFIIGFSFGGIYEQFRKPREMIIQVPIKEIEKCQCEGLTTDQVKMIIRQEFVNAFQFNWAIDGAVKDSEFKPFLKSILKELE